MGEGRTFLRRAVPFALIGLALYGGLYTASERLIERYARRNRFFMVQAATQDRYGQVILGTSHAAVFDYEDMNARLEQLTRTKVLNLAIAGAGVTVNRLSLEYFLARHETSSVVYFLDSFAFYSSRWNERTVRRAALPSSAVRPGPRPTAVSASRGSAAWRSIISPVLESTITAASTGRGSDEADLPEAIGLCTSDRPATLNICIRRRWTSGRGACATAIWRGWTISSMRLQSQGTASSPSNRLSHHASIVSFRERPVSTRRFDHPAPSGVELHDFRSRSRTNGCSSTPHHLNRTGVLLQLSRTACAGRWRTADNTRGIRPRTAGDGGRGVWPAGLTSWPVVSPNRKCLGQGLPSLTGQHVRAAEDIGRAR